MWARNAASYSPPPRRSIAAAPVVKFEDASDETAPAVVIGFVALLAAAGLALGFAALPRRVLGTVSTRLVDRRDDIGLAVTVSMTVAAVMFLILLVT